MGAMSDSAPNIANSQNRLKLFKPSCSAVNSVARCLSAVIPTGVSHASAAQKQGRNQEQNQQNDD
jgi:hypothetical protein